MFHDNNSVPRDIFIKKFPYFFPFFPPETRKRPNE